jgi:hypothetical protein
MAAADHQDDVNKLIQCTGDMKMTSHRISHLAAALAGVLTMSCIATQVLAQEIDQLDERTVHRRAIEAVVWGMPAVNAQLMFDAAKNYRLQPGGVLVAAGVVEEPDAHAQSQHDLCLPHLQHEGRRTDGAGDPAGG